MAEFLKRLRRALAEAPPGWGGAPDARRWPAESGYGALAGSSCAIDDRYTIEGEVGRGGTAIVFLATDRRYDRRVALKVLRPDLVHDVGRGQFLREIRLAAQLMHPHILPVFDSGEVADLLYFVMPVAEGGSLRVRLQHEQRIPLGEAVQIVREVSGALDYAHRRQVVHRDIKPGNILFHESVAMVADFGVGKALCSAGEEFVLRDGSVVGTIPYMSPEQVEGRRDVDGRSDLYSLGCVLYEMLTGMPVFSGPTPGAILARRVSDPKPELVLPEEIPDDVRSVIRSLLAATPAERPASGAEILGMLTHATSCHCHSCGME